LSVNETPFGSIAVSVSVGAGDPVAVTVNVPGVPTVKVVLFPLVMTGAVSTVNVKFCVASAPTPLCAVITIGNAPPTAGVPLSTPVELVNVTPPGNGPVSLKIGAGKPAAIIVNVPGAPTVKFVIFALANEVASFTVSMKLCITSAPAPLCAVNVMGYAAPVPAPGIPVNMPVAGVKVTPLGSVPDSLSVGAGVPVAVTVNVLAMPTVKVALFALVIVGACCGAGCAV
jgi:hypothetical protein